MVGRLGALKPNAYGFILTEGGTDYFFHISDLADRGEWDRMRIGNSVEFEPEHTPKGPVARQVRILST
jgi:cold shock CspA family protein